MAIQQPSSKARKKGPKLTKDGKITVFDTEDASYGIRELIDLIRYIPEGQDVFFGAEMIKKTLGSMQISIHDIMQDGVEKRKLASKTIQHLVAEISDYQRRIQSLKGHIRHLRFELGEIQDTCHYLLSDDVELSQYQHILDEVAKSPIEGDDEHEAPHEAASTETASTEPSQKISTEKPELQSNDAPEKITPSNDFQHTETLVEPEKPEEDNDFIPDAITNPDEGYAKTNEPSLSNLTDEVFNPDRFDDENGVGAKANPLTISASVHNEVMQAPAIDSFTEEATPTHDNDAEQDKTSSSSVEESTESEDDFTKRL